MTTSTIQAPKTVGPNLAGLTVREQAEAAWDKESTEARRKAERAALNLARGIFGNVSIEFDDFISEEFAKRNYYYPWHLVTFEVEGLEFNYRPHYDGKADSLQLIDMCECGRGPRVLMKVEKLSDIARAHYCDFSGEVCASCTVDEDRAKRRPGIPVPNRV